jgi:hypothetical protein
VELIRLFGSDAATAEATAETQRAPRLEAEEAGLSRDVKLSPGGAAELLNVSETGLLVEGKTRLSTGSKVLITLNGREQKRLTGRVVRCQVCAIHRDGTMTYQTALALDQPAGLENIGAETAAPTATDVSEASAPPEPAPVANTAPRLVNQW